MLCPYVQRAYFALSAKKIPYQKVNVDLRNKAKWHLDLNGGLIPVLESPDGTLVNESGFIA
jgi:glutathione S-transferase